MSSNPSGGGGGGSDNTMYYVLVGATCVGGLGYVSMNQSDLVNPGCGLFCCFFLFFFTLMFPTVH